MKDTIKNLVITFLLSFSIFAIGMIKAKTKIDIEALSIYAIISTAVLCGGSAWIIRGLLDRKEENGAE